MLTRVISGLCLTAIVFAAIIMQGYVYIAVLTVALLICLNEMVSCLKAGERNPVSGLVYGYALLECIAQACVLATGGTIMTSLAVSMLVLIVTVMAVFTYQVLKGSTNAKIIEDTLFPIFYPGVFIAVIYSLGMINGRMMTLVALMLTFFVANMNDLLALVIGVKFGKHKLSPAISPKKTIEGSIAGLAAAVVFGMLIPYLAMFIIWIIPSNRHLICELPPLWSTALVGLIAGVLSQVGDLAASLLKRHCGIKDFGKILPGHGGIMDRIDGVLFSGIAFVVYFLIIGA